MAREARLLRSPDRLSLQRGSRLGSAPYQSDRSGVTEESQVRTRLPAGGRWIRTFGSWSRDRQTVMGGGLLSKRERICRGTEGSNPSPSSGESTANPVGLAPGGMASAAATLAVRPQSEVRRLVFEYWRDQVAGLGAGTASDVRLITAEKNQRLYWLLLAAKHDLARRFWRVAANVEKQGKLL
jgi:hypothetical protein